jgi:hypothetical protein
MASKGRELLGSCRLLCKGEGTSGTRESRLYIEPKPNALFILGKKPQGNAHIRQEGFRCEKKMLQEQWSLGYVCTQNSPTVR